MHSCLGIDFLSFHWCSPWSTRIKCSSSLSLYRREAALYFHDCIKDLNEIHTIILVPQFSVQAGRCSSVPVRAITGFMIVLMKCKSLVTWWWHLMSRRKKGAPHGLSYFPPLIRSSSNTQFRTFPTSIYFISTMSNTINVSFILHKSTFCPIQCLLPVVTADTLNCGCKWWSVWLAVPDCFFSCWLSHVTLVL